ncbi:MAG: glycosyltransferase involved in cell wall biosynthesis [Kiritimatiellia bacterium]|jgi:glycosyltransferase involved in cell wall biosynthesis
MLDLSVVIPVMDEEENVEELIRELVGVLDTLGKSYEVIAVDDGSSDSTWSRMVKIAETTPHTRMIRFRRNFGQTAAMSAGFQAARGEIIVAMDGDLQNDPASIPALLDVMTDDVDVVSGWRKDRKDRLARRIPSQMANRLISKMTGVYLHDYGCSLKAYRKSVLDSIRLYGQMHRFIPALASWAGNNVQEVVVNHRPRVAGKAKYPNLGRTGRVILDLITVKFLLRYAMGPMQIFGKIGLFFGGVGAVIFAMMFLDFLFVEHAQGTTPLVKRPIYVMSGFMFILFCIQFISMGLLAEIQIRTYHEAQDKATYVIRETVAHPAGV